MCNMYKEKKFQGILHTSVFSLYTHIEKGLGFTMLRTKKTLRILPAAVGRLVSPIMIVLYRY